MTPEQRQKVKELAGCTFLPGSYQKRFVVSMSTTPDDVALSEKQAAYLDKLHHSYRNQIMKLKAKRG